MFSKLLKSSLDCCETFWVSEKFFWELALPDLWTFASFPISWVDVKFPVLFRRSLKFYEVHWASSMLPGHCPNSSTICKVPWASKNFPYYLQSSLCIWKISWIYDYLSKNLRSCLNFCKLSLSFCKVLSLFWGFNISAEFPILRSSLNFFKFT